MSTTQADGSSSNNTQTSGPEAAAAGAGRDGRGRFSKGNPGGPGNPFARRVAAMRQALMDAVTAEDIAVITKKMVEQAREGDVAAARLVFTYIVGKPQTTEDPDRLDEKEWQQYVHETVKEGEVEAVVGGMSATLACNIASNAVPHLQAKAGATLRAGLLAMDEIEEEVDEAPDAAGRSSEKVEQPRIKPAEGPETDEARTPELDEAEERMEIAAAKLVAMLLGTVNHPAETAKRVANADVRKTASRELPSHKSDKKE